MPRPTHSPTAPTGTAKTSLVIDREGEVTSAILSQHE